MRRIRQLLATGVATAVLAGGLGIGGLALGLTMTVASPEPASADCSHGNHPDRYSGGRITYGNNANIRVGPHVRCRSIGFGQRSHNVDVHCVAHNGTSGNTRHWLWIRNLSTNRAGWTRWDALRYQNASASNPVRIRHCGNPDLFFLVFVENPAFAPGEADRLIGIDTPA